MLRRIVCEIGKRDKVPRMADLPDYDQLPAVGGKPPGSSWGIWGDDDVLGCLNLLTPERVQRGAATVRKGAVFALNYDLAKPDPPLFGGRDAPEHTVAWLAGEVGHDDELSGWNTQTSSQWDGFRHIRSLVHGFYNGVADEDHGVHHWARRGLAGRAVLSDVERHLAGKGQALRGDERYEITPDDIRSTLVAQGSPVEVGDVLLIRTGWLGWYRALDDPQREEVPANLATPGLRSGEETAGFLWDLHIAAVAADNPALEAWPPPVFTDPEALQAIGDPTRASWAFLHFSLLPLLGLPIGELWDLDALAADCAADGVYEVFLTSAPLNLLNGVASPPNALAIK